MGVKGQGGLDDLVERLHIDEAAVVAFVETLAELPDELIAEAARVFGYRVLPTP